MAEENTTGGSLFSPEAVLMFMIAGILDLAGLINLILDFFGIGLGLSFVLDIIGFVIIGGWMFVRRGRITITKKLFKRLGLSTIGELIPFFGDLAFCWTAAVFFELKD